MKRKREIEDNDMLPRISTFKELNEEEECKKTIRKRFQEARDRSCLDLSLLTRVQVEEVDDLQLGRVACNNNVLRGNLSWPVNLTRLAKEGYASYDQGTFVAAKVRFGEASVLLFPNGKIMVTGSSSVSGALVVIGHLRRILRQVSGRTFAVHNLGTCNVVCSMTLPAPLDLKKLHRTFNGHVRYDAEMFPGAFMDLKRMSKFEDCEKVRNAPPSKLREAVSLLAFHSGTVAAAGLRPALHLSDPNFHRERQQMLDDLLLLTRMIMGSCLKK